MTTETIIEGCRRGRRDCQRELVLRYSPQLMTVARRYATDSSAAQDILQDSLVKIIQKIDQYAGTGSFEGWMRRIVISTALNGLDRKWVRRERSGLEHLPEESNDPAVFSQLATEEIMGCLQRLPDGYRQIFNLYAIEGYKHREIAQMMGISESTSRSQYTRAKAQLQSILLEQKIVVRHAR